MLKKADGRDACSQAFAQWRALLPYWNDEADRVRRLALSMREGIWVDPTRLVEAEGLVRDIRHALEEADRLMTMTYAGDAALAMLLRASVEFEALLESLQTSLEMAEANPGLAGISAETVTPVVNIR